MPYRLLSVVYVVGICVVAGLATVSAPRAAFADAAFAVLDQDLLAAPGQNGVRITLSAPMSADRHQVRVVLPDPLSSLYTGSQDAGCTGPQNDLTCTPNYPTTTSFVIIVANPAIDMDGRSFVVTATDLVTNETRNGTVRVHARSDVELQYLGVTELDPHVLSVDAFVFNRGPSDTATTTLRETFTGGYVVQQLPTGCSLAGATVTCQLGPLPLIGYVRPHIVLTATGPIGVTGVVESSSLETDPSDNSQGPVAYYVVPVGSPPSYAGGGPGGGQPVGRAPNTAGSAVPTGSAHP